ncbi:hypothetical protein CDD81_1557 [Ophiocordyceps australis]|uniref:Terpene synthase n=1 Tax=Ophiocordyceps australis TaxID=1399860 RepID=A0A2C5Y002_9HYPO|nr:hypothetical protein CDD81_1557 [Ophiocordyceps australis]
MPAKKLLDDTCTAPVVQSRFPCHIHPARDELEKLTQQTYAQSLEHLTKKEAVTKQAFYVACASKFCAYTFPDGDFERLKAISNYFMAGTFVDDLVDNSTDLEYVSEMICNYRAAVAGSLRGHPQFDLILDFFTDSRWNHAALALLQAETNLYLDCTLAVRQIEIERRLVTVEEYLKSRALNAFMGVLQIIAAFALPQLTQELVRVCTLAPESIRLALTYCGASAAVVLDMYKLNGKHSEICEYTNIVKIVQRASRDPCSVPEALDLTCKLFHEYEEKLALQLDEIAVLSPQVADTMRKVHGGTILWLGDMRGKRYSKRMDDDTLV